ncbi:phosphoribosylformylglycinamidine synthase subunit PurS [Bartonella tamiae]|uniref:Phosphoribosylformylglycinamidine synthase subunit PurS n=1 Tax=Bartonella tamiae Th239 TaxID=1094558 RepID=J0QSD8_9HYPH|nr:phosphoribosylformylglycinamidine synthase subunit PurS [Bartonella tamiae]EJF88781.1 phosphoribosylformylglycinamidine synthase, purS protein [Bartonella tamiae Th239]EJF94969.1 phosphoribosylformylglycinamidine synthase, purS protein [Bartonella tamiae Th307]
MEARVSVTLKNGVLDPQGKAIGDALQSLAFQHVQSIRQGKVFHIILDDMPKEKAHEQLTMMCEQLLANTVIENYHIDIL